MFSSDLRLLIKKKEALSEPPLNDLIHLHSLPVYILPDVPGYNLPLSVPVPPPSPALSDHP
jgi:hypothetical protein